MSLLSRLAVQAARAYGILSAADKNKVVAEYLVVAGGGSGGYNPGGGGGAGGLLTSTATLSTLNTYSITVGAGGAANGLTGASQGFGNQGSNSVISGTGLSTITSLGGGYGGAGGSTGSGGNGGSGGGAGGAGTVDAVGLGTSGQGNNGGTAAVLSGYWAGGGGGGAGAVGGNAISTGGVGGNGIASSISGSSVTYAGGGGGSGDTRGVAGGAGGNGGGGLGGGNGTTSVAGTANRGGGGGGGSYNGAISAAGGSGIVIISYTSATPKFVGGTITTSGGKQIHTFTSSGTLSPITPITASYLVVAGGGGGQGDRGGGGGAGGLLTSSTTLYSGATYVVTVGAGGNGSSGTGATNGSNSVLSGTGLTTLTSIGGGYSGGGVTGGVGASGGSGGGGSAVGSTGQAGGAGTSGQGYAGGTGYSTGSGYFSAAGGGGAGAVGTNGSASSAGAGGVGINSSISGTATYYAGGGGGSADNRAFTAAGTGGTGGGGSGGALNSNGSSGTPNTGGGGGGGSGGVPVYNGGNGGSGIVIISYAGSQQFNGGLVTSSGGNTIHTFTSTGALTPLTNNLNNSLRFRASASAYLSRTPTLAGSTTIGTLSNWLKLGAISTDRMMYHVIGTSGNNNRFYISFNADNTFQIVGYNSSASIVLNLNTTQVLRDPSAWYHIVVAIDTTQATSSNRAKLYINGNQVTAFSTATYPSQNQALGFTNNTSTFIGANQGPSNYFDGYMTDINFIDGQALEPYYFGNNDANGVWKPIQYKGTYGTNGFYLTFGNTTSTTTLGYDSSPNGNNWTCNNISLTAGTTYDAMTDVPTNTSATVANYAVMNPLWKDGTTVIAQGNLDVSNGNYGGFSTLTIPTNSKFYAEFTVTATQGNQGVGILKAANAYSGVISQADMFSSNSVTYYSTNGNKFVLGGGSTAYGSSWGTIGDVIGIAVNTVDNQITFYKNNTSQGVITGLTSGIEWVFATGNQTNTGGGAWNFGQRPFSYTPPTGYVRLNTFNLPTPTILQGNKYMDATLYTGNGGTQVIVNQAQFKPDFVWYKQRNTTRDNGLEDSVRGAQQILISNSTNAEVSASGITSFNSNGFTQGSNVIGNQSGGTYVGWQWQAGQGSTSSNTSGSITSTVSVNTTAGFSVLTYTGNNTLSTIGHGLGASPKFIIVKTRSGTDGWVVYHASLGVQYYSFLNTTDASYNNLANYWGSTAPSSTTFSINAYGGVNTNGATYVAYCWAEIAGFSKFGSYTGNGSTDGPFIATNFKPKFVMIKVTSTTNVWLLIDATRNPYNVANLNLNANDSAAENTASTGAWLDFTSNGFKIRNGSDSAINSNGATYVYACFASHPFKNSNAV